MITHLHAVLGEKNQNYIVYYLQEAFISKPFMLHLSWHFF